ncbi:MAG TPA: cyanophycinase [Candidatus Thermoplasmatota archaeon]|nr:cyanophycinase [Candidatus Thermoplasmatota archaeon]
MGVPGKGTLIAVGGGEDKAGEMRILRRALEHAPVARRIVILPSASVDPLWAAELHVDAFRRLGATTVDILDVRAREHAAHPAVVESVRQADLVYMTGGDQARLAALLAGTPVLAALHENMDHGGVVAGTSAGAAAMSATMIAEGAATMRKGSVRLTPGLGLLPHVVLDTHFTERGRFARIFEAVATHPGLLGMGLAEDTAIVVRGGEVEVVGAGSVVVVDGREMHSSNAKDAEHDAPLDAERLIVSTYSHGRTFPLERAPTALARRGRAKA